MNSVRPRLLLVPGSQRTASFNARLLQDLARRLQGRCDVDRLHGREVDLPLFNQDLEGDAAVLQRVAALHARFEASHGLIVASPEYNGQLPPFLKNLVDWVSRLAWIDRQYANPYVDRPVLLCTVSTGGSGGALAIPHARALFGYVGGVVIGDSISIAQAAQAWRADGWVFPQALDQQIDGALARVLRLATAHANPAAGPARTA